MQNVQTVILDTELVNQVKSDISERLKTGGITLDEAADALLAAAGQLSRENGTYTEQQLARRSRLDRERMPKVEPYSIPEETTEYLLDERLNGLVDLAHLKPMEEICLRLSVSGMSVREIAVTIGLGRRRAELHLRVARRKTRAVYREGPYAGWYEVYLSEVRRGKRD